MSKWLLLLVLIKDGDVHTYTYQFAELLACNDTAYSMAVSAEERGHELMVSACYPISKKWKLKSNLLRSGM